MKYDLHFSHFLRDVATVFKIKNPVTSVCWLLAYCPELVYRGFRRFVNRRMTYSCLSNNSQRICLRILSNRRYLLEISPINQSVVSWPLFRWRCEALSDLDRHIFLLMSCLRVSCLHDVVHSFIRDLKPITPVPSLLLTQSHWMRLWRSRSPLP